MRVPGVFNMQIKALKYSIAYVATGILFKECEELNSKRFIVEANIAMATANLQRVNPKLIPSVHVIHFIFAYRVICKSVAML